MSPRLSRTISVALTLPAVWSIEWLCKPWPLRHRHSLECLALQAPLCLPSGIGTHLSAWPVRHPFVCPSGSGTHLSVWHFWHPLLALQVEPFRQQYPLGYLALQAYRVLLSLSPLTRSVGQERNFKLLTGGIGAFLKGLTVPRASLFCPSGAWPFWHRHSLECLALLAPLLALQAEPFRQQCSLEYLALQAL